MNLFKIITFCSIALVAIQCQNSTPANQETPASIEPQPVTDETVIHLTTAQIANAGIETGGFTPRPLSDELTTTAELTVGKEHSATVSAFADGVLSDLRISSNQTVLRGAVIAIMRKPDLVDMQQQFLENKDHLLFFQTEYDRYRTLKDADATASKNFTKAEAELRSARTTGQVLAAKLRQYQINPDQLTPENLKTEIAITAPISGTVSKIMANVGTAMVTGTAVCEIIDYTQLHPVLFIFEKDIAKIRNGQQVQLQFPGVTTTSYAASIYNIERAVDPERKTIKVHARLATNPPAHFTLGAYMEARIALSGSANTPALPTAAIVREGSADFIFIQESATADGATFRRIPVRTGSSDQAFTAVMPFNPIPEGMKIVLKGAYYVSAQGAGVTAE